MRADRVEISGRTYWRTVRGLHRAIRLFGPESDAAARYAAELSEIQDAFSPAVRKAASRELLRLTNDRIAASGRALATSLFGIFVVMSVYVLDVAPRGLWVAAAHAVV